MGVAVILEVLVIGISFLAWALLRPLQERRKLVRRVWNDLLGQETRFLQSLEMESVNDPRMKGVADAHARFVQVLVASEEDDGKKLCDKLESFAEVVGPLYGEHLKRGGKGSVLLARRMFAYKEFVRVLGGQSSRTEQVLQSMQKNMTDDMMNVVSRNTSSPANLSSISSSSSSSSSEEQKKGKSKKAQTNTSALPRSRTRTDGGGEAAAMENLCILMRTRRFRSQSVTAVRMKDLEEESDDSSSSSSSSSSYHHHHHQVKKAKPFVTKEKGKKSKSALAQEEVDLGFSPTLRLMKRRDLSATNRIEEDSEASDNFVTASVMASSDLQNTMLDTMELTQSMTSLETTSCASEE